MKKLLSIDTPVIIFWLFFILQIVGLILILANPALLENSEINIGIPSIIGIGVLFLAVLAFVATGLKKRNKYSLFLALAILFILVVGTMFSITVLVLSLLVIVPLVIHWKEFFKK